MDPNATLVAPSPLALLAGLGVTAAGATLWRCVAATPVPSPTIKRRGGAWKSKTCLRVSVGSLLLSLAFLAPAWGAPGPTDRSPLLFLGNDQLPPFIWVENDEPVGLVVDLVRAVDDQAALQARIEGMDWPRAQALVAAGEADALLQINPSPERERVYDFSGPLLESHFHLFRQTDRPAIQGLDSLAGRRVGVEAGGLPQQYLQGHGQTQPVVIPNWRQGFAMLQSGQLDAVFVDRWVGEYELSLNRIAGVAIVEPAVFTSTSRIAVKKGNQALLARLDAGLAAIAADGTRAQILRRWQGKEVVYVTRESVDRLTLLAAGSFILLLTLIASMALFYAYKVRQSNRLLRQRECDLQREGEERDRAVAALQALQAQLEQRIAARTAELQQRELRFRTLFEASADAIGLLGPHGFIECNTATLRLYGCANEREFLDKDPLDFSPPTQPGGGDSRTLAEGHIARAFRDGHHVFEWRHRRLDGNAFDIDISLTRIDLPEGPVLQAIARDITQRKEAESARQESEARFRTLFESSSDAQAIFAEDRWLDCNAAALALFGCARREDFLGRHPADFSPPTQPGGADSRVLAKETIEHAIRAGVHRFDWRHRRLDGTEFDAQVQATRMHLNGRLVLHGAIRDVTEQQRLHQTLARSEERLRQQMLELRQANEDLAVFNRASVGRELRMIELKKQINALLILAGEPPLYPLPFESERVAGPILVPDNDGDSGSPDGGGTRERPDRPTPNLDNSPGK